MATSFDITPEKRATALSFLKRQFFRKTPAVTKAEVDLTGQTAIVTGSNVGLGFECSRQLLELGVSKLILAVRNTAKGEAAMEKLVTLLSIKSQTLEVWQLDMSVYESITQFAERVKTLDRLDIFVHNAGISNQKLHLNPNTGYDEVIQTNYLSSVLLTVLLLPILKGKNSPTSPGRFTLVSSETAAWAAFKEKDKVPLLPEFKKTENHDAPDRYWTSKLLGLLFLSELAKRVPSSVAVVNAANPGMCYGSNLTGDWDGVGAVIFGILNRLIGRSAPLGARALVDGAVRHGPKSHCQYLEDGKLQPMPPLVYSVEGEKIASQLWEETMSELAFANVAETIKSLST
ncbi:hypothetical protein FSARC_12073 [Fusarium sarcochroum]|uniref:Short-chain dehydrogenase/reductase n=1 Tax=Fusarium sarcochroum TaxID=1208366 RepID=A0A8H4WYQ0_9HYPO|nr:hypothetical protein FSARC_12073 [Fusarium sarcochroum]